MGQLTHWVECNQQEVYITKRVINAFIRENVEQILSKGEIINKAPSDIVTAWPLTLPAAWLKVTHVSEIELWLPVKSCDFMQPWQVCQLGWILKKDKQINVHNHFSQWLSFFISSLSKEDAAYFNEFAQECYCAVTQKSECENIYQDKSVVLNKRFAELSNGLEQMLLADQLAAHIDHPFYPTARAKFGLNNKNLRLYCPEAMNTFELRWAAIPKSLCSNTTRVLPTFWPSFSQVGLSEALSSTHQLVPIHPMMLDEYLPKNLADWLHLDDIVIAPDAVLRVKPTLSVRTMALVGDLSTHIKLPLSMKTLGSKNIRTIKPSTVNDGYVFQQLLQRIAQDDLTIQKRVLFADEAQGGFVDNRTDLAWLVRTYPEELSKGSPVCVASFLAVNPNGQLVIEQLANCYYQSNIITLLMDYINLQLSIHLKLWLKYGVALEVNQQNALILFSKDNQAKLVLRDNDSGRILAPRLTAKLPHSKELLQHFIDQRMFAKSETALVQMFTTITLQLNIGCIIEALHDKKLLDKKHFYGLLEANIRSHLSELTQEGIDTNSASDYLLNQDTHYAKYLMSAGSLLSKAKSGAASINKFYGLSAPNFIRNCRNGA